LILTLCRIKQTEFMDNEHFTRVVNHIAKFAMMPHWLEEMRRFTNELQQQKIYQGLGLAVADKIKFLKDQQK